VSTNPVMDTSGSGRRNRSWPEALKREIVASSFAAGASVSVIARRYEVNANQVFRWRQLYRNGLQEAADPAAARLLPVIVADEDRGDVAPAPRALDTIEIELAGRYRVRVGSGVDGTALGRVLDVLERR
jgi:transposase